MFLDTTTRKLQIILTAAKTTTDMSVIVDYVDITTTTTVPGITPSLSNGVTAVDILAAPAASTQRKVNGLEVYNADTASKVVEIRLNDNATLYTIVKITLGVGDTLGYTDVRGWYVQNANGEFRTTIIGATLTSAQFATILSDETGTGVVVFGTSPTITTPNIVGTATNDNAAAGSVGECIESTVGLTNCPATGVYGDLTSISLTAGDWDVSCTASFVVNGATITNVLAGISATSGNSSVGLVQGYNYAQILPPTTAYNSDVAVSLVRVPLNATTTYYLKYRSTYSAGTPQCAGHIIARRFR